LLIYKKRQDGAELISNRTITRSTSLSRENHGLIGFYTLKNAQERQRYMMEKDRAISKRRAVCVEAIPLLLIRPTRSLLISVGPLLESRLESEHRSKLGARKRTDGFESQDTGDCNGVELGRD
jgi:hypothetical protein